MSSNQCLGKTQSGTRCKKLTRASYCSIHSNQKNPISHKHTKVNPHAKITVKPSAQSSNQTKVITKVKPKIKPKIKPSTPSEECCVCLDPVSIPLKPCNHMIHPECVYKAGSNLCPLCRNPVHLSSQHKRLVKKYKLQNANYHNTYIPPNPPHPTNQYFEDFTDEDSDDPYEQHFADFIDSDDPTGEYFADEAYLSLLGLL